MRDLHTFDFYCLVLVATPHSRALYFVVVSCGVSLCYACNAALAGGAPLTL